tara:strand:- start:156 stop:293 length:138 start_codon:yes stop_codon:yes gene_type:complete
LIKRAKEGRGEGRVEVDNEGFSSRRRRRSSILPELNEIAVEEDEG